MHRCGVQFDLWDPVLLKSGEITSISGSLFAFPALAPLWFKYCSLVCLSSNRNEDANEAIFPRLGCSIVQIKPYCNLSFPVHMHIGGALSQLLSCDTWLL
jgi:hypothetical protein